MNGLIKARIEGVLTSVAGSVILAWSLTACGGGGGTAGSPATGNQSLSAEQGVTPAPAPAPSTPSIDTTPAWASSLNAMVATFDTPADNVSNWSFYPGSEFAGANGSLVEGVGLNNTKAGSLVYDLGCNRSTDGLPNTACGRYVSMDLRPSKPIDTSSISQPTIGLWIHNTQGTARPSIRITDSTNQVLQFKVQLRSIEQPAAGEWQYVEVPVASSSAYFNGANDGVLHSPIKAISVMNGDLPMAYVPGTMEVDNVQVLNAPSTQFTLKTNSQLSSTAFPSTYVGHIGVAVQTYTTAALDKAAAAGITLIRKDLCWACVEVNGNMSFSRYNTFMSDLAARGMSVLWILDYGHPDHGGSTPLTQGDQAAYAAFARQAALQYRSAAVAGYEIWNEPDIPAYWPSPDANAYANLFNTARTAIQSAAPGTKVVTGGIAGDDYTYLYNMVNTGKVSGASAIGIHPYRTVAPETFAADIQPLLRVTRNGGVNAALWDTEWGYSSYGDLDASVYGNGADPRALRRQGVLVLRKVLTNIALNTPVSVIYSLQDAGTNATDREQNFGLLTADGSDKPAILGLRSLYAAQNGRVLKGFLPDVPPNLHVLRWDGSTDQSFVVWTERINGAYSITLPSKTSSVKLWDGTVIMPTVSGGQKQITVTEANGPVFVTVSQ